MDPYFWVQLILPITATAVFQEVRWRRRRRSELESQRVAAYERLLAVSDLSYSAAQELAHLQHGLHWWNGRSRLHQLKATRLDERVLRLTEEIAGAVTTVRLYGTPEAVIAAEQVLEAVGTPLLDADVDEDEALAKLTTARARFLEVTREQAELKP